MRLIKCHVENFGTLCGFDVEFREGLTVIKEENGFGKSTFAVFLKAMFYGLPQTSKRSIDENDRKKYTPWQGGAFGGTLDFEAGGRQYRIERFFAAKEKDDTFRLYDLLTNTETDDFSENIGLELFGIDADSFERSVYMPQTDTETSMNNSLRAKLTGLVENSDDISNFDNAVKALEKRAKEYSVLGGARGAIADKSAQIAQLEARRHDASAAAENLKTDLSRLSACEEKKQNIKQAIDKVRAEITAASDSAARAEQAKRRNELSEELTKLSAGKAEIVKRYPLGLPTEDALQETAETVKLADETAAELGLLEASTADRDELARLDGFFNGQLPTEQEIANCRGLLNQAIKDEAALEGLSSRVEAAKSVKPGSNGRAVKVILGLSALLAVVGAVTMVWMLAVGMILLALGIVAAGAAAFVYLKNMISAGNSKGEDPAVLQKEYAELQEKVRSARDIVAEFTSKYLPDTLPSEALDVIAQNLRDRGRLSTSVAEQDRKLSQRKDRMAECKALLTDFFSKYGAWSEGSFADRLAAVKNDIRELGATEQRLAYLQEKLAEIPQADVDADQNAVESKEQLVAREQQLTEQFSAVERDISLLEASVRRLTAETDGLPEIEEQLENAREQRTEMEARLNVLSTTLELLKKAKTDLSLRYLDRMTAGFDKYSAVITGEEPGDSMIDTDLCVRLNRGGAARDKEYFSRGYRDMIDIAMRMALADALYENERPMLILDDPFVNLDDRRLENAMALLKKLAENRQIIYLTCHSSRC